MRNGLSIIIILEDYFRAFKIITHYESYNGKFHFVEFSAASRKLSRKQCKNNKRDGVAAVECKKQKKRGKNEGKGS